MVIGTFFWVVFQYIYLRRNIFVAAIIIIILVWVIMTFLVCKWCHKKILDNINFIDYSPKSRKNIEMYGDLPIRNVYVVREPMTSTHLCFVDIMTFNNVTNQILQYRKDIEDNYFFPNHTYIILDIEMPNKCIKKIMIDRNPQLCISLRLKLWDNTELLKLNVKKKNKITLRKILDETKNRVGCERFFNWNIYTNNCQYFTSELLSTMRLRKRRCIEFVDQDDFKKRCIVLSEFKLHVFNCFTNLYSFLSSCFVEM